MAAPQNTASTHRSSAVRGTHQFHIAGYSERKRFGRCLTDENDYDTDEYDYHSDGFIKSGAFQVGNYTWVLVCTFGDQGDHLNSITLKLLSTDDVTKDIIAAASVQIDDPLGRSPPAVWRSHVAHRFSAKRPGMRWKLSLPYAFCCGNQERYVSGDDDSLTILCTVDVLQEDAGETRNSLVSVVPAPTITHDFQQLLLPMVKCPKSSYSDVTFLVEETEFHAHRLVLAMRSPVFAAELFGYMSESIARRVRIEDMRASTFKAMLQFIYSDELPTYSNMESESRRNFKEEEYMARNLLVAADRYDLERLRLICENILCENINMATVLTTLLLVRGRQRCRQLEDCCINYITSGPDVYEALKATKEFEELKETCSSFIIEVTDRVATHDINTSSPSSSFRPPEKSTSMYRLSEVAARGTHEFIIPNFSSLQRSRGVGQVITSNIFNVGGYDWTINVYPSGYSITGDEEQYISVYLRLWTHPQTASVKSSKRFRIDDPNGKSPSTVLGSEDIFTRVRQSWGFQKFITIKSAKSQYIGHDGSLTIHCDLDVHMGACHKTISTTIPKPMIVVPPSNIAGDLKKLMVSNQWSDVTFLVEESEIHTHRLIIAVRSPLLFETIVASKTNGVLPIENMKAVVLRAMLHFIYTDELLPVDDALVAGEMLSGACRFRLERMRAMCENLLAHLLSKDNALSILELALSHHCKELKLYCMEFISRAMN